jgi:hypothetical protein
MKIVARLAASAVAIGSVVATWGTALAQPATSPQTAQTTSPSAAPAASPDKSQAKTDPDDEIVCKDEETTGSRLGARRVCLPRHEWKRMARDSADWLNDPHKKLEPPH